MIRSPRNRWLAPMLVLVSACAGSPDPRSSGPHEPPIDEVSGVGLITIARPTDGRVWLSLWIDAGARDADPPSLAAIAAWVATAAQPSVHARALADGIELSRACEREALSRCLDELAAALATRQVDEAAVSHAHRRLVAVRRRTAADAGRTADALAVNRLLGRPSDPLASSEDEDEAPPSPQHVRHFLAQHFGRGRVLLVAVGDVTLEELRAYVGRAFARSPAAGAERASRGASAERWISVEVGHGSAVSVATLQSEPAAARTMAHRLLSRVQPELEGATASADVFPVRGGTVLLARVRRSRTGSPEDSLEPVLAASQVLLTHLAELLEEAPSVAGEARPAESPAAIARWLGARWVAGHHAPRPGGGLAIGAVVNGGRADTVDADDPDARTRSAARRQLQETMDLAFAPATLEGTVGADAVDAQFRGARIRVRRVSDASAVGVAVVFTGGAAEEASSSHGATNLLATVAASACERVATEELGAGLDSLGFVVQPVLTAEAWGIAVVGPAARWAELTYLAPRCAEVPHLTPGEVDLAKERVRWQIDGEDLRAEVALLLSSAAPGRVAPLGRAANIPRLSVSDLRRWRAQRVTASRARLAVVGDVDAAVVAQRIARRVARWPEGLPPDAIPWVPPQERLRAVPRDGELSAVVAWVANADGRAEPAARAFGRAVARSFAAEPGLSPRWSVGGAAGGKAWAAVGLGAEATALDELPARTARAIRAIAHRWSELAPRVASSAAASRAWAGASMSRLAVRLALELPPPPVPEEAHAVLRALAEAPPVFVVARPAPGGRD